MVLPLETNQYLEYFLKRDVTKLYLSVAIRNLALGMVLLFEPIYIYLYFGESLPLARLFFAAMFGLFGFLAPFGGRLMAKIGTTKSILLSLLFYFGYYLSLFFFPVSFLFVPLSLLLITAGMLLFWPAFHTDFARFSSEQRRGREVGRLNVISLIPLIVSPALGGWVLASFGYPVLFIVVLVVLLASSLPLFYCKETHEAYEDSYKKAWKRAWRRENRGTTAGFAFAGLEHIIYFLFWPLFLFVLAVHFDSIGAIASLALVASSLFMLYVGRVSDTQDRSWLLNIGALWTSVSWVLKFFVTTAFDALLAHTLYRISLAAANIPFQTFFYEKAASKGPEADEFVVHREIIVNVSRFFLLSLLALVFFLFPSLPVHGMFLVAAVFALGLMLAGQPPKLSLR
ncbi:MAG: MFS transporter, partial [Candidatus Pacearchaeota archaeon]|nr:MFS transporter [Candidatus Pacearchaeota archaeon]